MRLQLRRLCAYGRQDYLSREAAYWQPVDRDVVDLLEITFDMGVPNLDRAAPAAAFAFYGIGYVCRNFLDHAHGLARLQVRGKMVFFPTARFFADVVVSIVIVPVPQMKPCQTCPKPSAEDALL